MSLFSAIFPDGEYRAARCEMLDRLIATADGDAALLYIYLLRSGAGAQDIDAMRALRFSKERFDRAAFTLTNLTIAQSAPAEQRPTSAPRYTMGELRSARETDHKFRAVCDTAETTIGRPLTEGVLRALFTIYDHIGLPADVMMVLLSYLSSEQGDISSKSMLREAYVWVDKSILTLEDAQRYLQQLEREKPMRAAFYSILGAIGRTPSAAEKTLVSYCIEHQFSVDAVQLAFDRMMRNNGSISINYLKKILQSWDVKNVHTAAEITAIEPERHAEAASSQPAAPQNPIQRDPDMLSDWEQDWLADVARLKNAQKGETK